MLRLAFGERGWVIPNERIETGRSARKGPSRKGFAAKAASRTQPASAIATAIVTRNGIPTGLLCLRQNRPIFIACARPAAHNLRLLRQKRAPRIIEQGFPGRLPAAFALCACLLSCAPELFGQQGSEDAPVDHRVFSCPDSRMGPAIPPAPDRSQAPIVIYAKALDASKTEQGQASGNVELFRLDQHMKTEQVLYDPVKEVVTLPGRVDYEDQQVWITGQEGYYSFPDESGHFSLINYGLTGTSANGSAEYIQLSSGNSTQLRQLNYTSCPGDRPDWQLQARELELDHDKGWGVARGAKLLFKGVPIVYAPYFTFPIDDRRKSGFLIPSFGQTNDSGLEVAVPWYWNIAPNQDATLEPRYFSDRGFMMSGQYRFLTQRTNAQLDFDYMPDDRIRNENRYHYFLEHNAYPKRRWNSQIILDRVSDDRYFQDFGTNLAETSIQFLRSSGTLTGSGRYWDFELMADDFQVHRRYHYPQ